MLKVSNIGQTLARDIKFTFEPPLTPLDTDHGLNAGTLLTEGIRTMPPGLKIERLFDNTMEWGEGGINQPIWSYDVTVTFKDYKNRDQEPLNYTIDLRHLMTGAWIESLTVHHGVKALRDIKKEVQKWSEGLGRDGIKVIARNGDAKDERRQQRLQEQQAQLAARKAAAEGASTTTD